MAVLERAGGKITTGILPCEIEDKKSSTRIGDTVRVYIWKEGKNGTYRTIAVEGIVLAKYRNVVVTTSGTFQWKQLLLEKPRS